MQKNIVLAAIVKNIPPNAYWHRKEEKLLNMKYLAIIALAALAIGLGACESNKPAASTSTSASTSYKK